MGLKVRLSVVVLLVISVYSCKKSASTATPTVKASTIANIDSITGYYVGTTSGDSIYTKSDGSQVINSFSWPDTLHITSPDTATIIASSKYYTISYFYGDSLTAADSVTTLRNQTTGENGYVVFSSSLLDTANSINHLIINIAHNYNKRLTSNVTLYKR